LKSAPAASSSEVESLPVSSSTIYADAGYQGPKMAKTTAATGDWKIEIVKRTDLRVVVR
jgi:hypothetical protein